MDRRTFLKTTTAAAAASTATAGAVHAREVISSPALVPSRHELRITLPVEPHAADASREILHDISLASSGRLIFHVMEASATDGIASETAASIARGQTDGTFGVISEICNDPALALFSGLPGDSPAPHTLLSWYEAGAGHMYLDETADDFGLNAMIAGHSGATTGLWADQAVNDFDDFLAADIKTVGLGSRVIQSLRREHNRPEPDRTQRAVHLEEHDCPPLQAIANMPAERRRVWYRNGIHNSGHATHFAVGRQSWNKLEPGDQFLIQTVARAAAHRELARAETEMKSTTLKVLAGLSTTLVRLPSDVTNLINEASSHIEQDVATDARPAARRAWSAWHGYLRALQHGKTTTTGGRNSANS